MVSRLETIGSIRRCVRYNIQDLQKGNISKERFDEIVSQVILKVDERVHDRASIVRNLTNLFRDVEKDILFKKAELEPDILKNSDYDENYKKLLWNIKTFLSNLKFIEAETIIIYYIHQMLKEAILQQMAELKTKRDDGIIPQISYQQQVAMLQNQYMMLLIKEREQLAKELGGLRVRREALIDEIGRLRHSIAEKKAGSVKEVMSHLIESGILKEATPEGENFSEQIIEIKLKNQPERERLHEAILNERQKLGWGVLNGKRSSPELRKLEKALDTLNREETEEIRKAAVASKIPQIPEKDLQGLVGHKRMERTIKNLQLDSMGDDEKINKLEKDLLSVDKDVEKKLEEYKELLKEFEKTPRADGKAPPMEGGHYGAIKDSISAGEKEPKKSGPGFFK